VTDSEDISSGNSQDCDENQIPDECVFDCNRNGLADPCDIIQGASADCDMDIFPDECEADYDADGAIDDCDGDIDNDGVPNAPDVCDESPLGIPVASTGIPIFDFNADCRINLADYSAMDNCILVSGPNDPTPASCLTRYDIDHDADVDLADVAVFQRAFTGS
jgi:hypothetical protein